MDSTILITILLLLIVAIIGVRFMELRDLVKAIGKQTDALSMYLSEQHVNRVELAMNMKSVQAACERVENKVDAIHRLLHRFDRREADAFPPAEAEHE